MKTKLNFSTVAMAASACCAALAQAQTQTIEITADKDRYQPALTQAATRSAVPVEQVPQSIVSIPRSVIEDQGSKTVSDALRNVSNVNEIDPRDSNNVGFKIRGFNAAMVVDGVSVPGWFQNQESLVGIQQMDVIKGPAGGLYGSGQAIGNYSTVGGTIAVTTKDPVATASREVGVKLGNFGRRNAHFDLNQPINEAWAFRVNGEHDRSDSETQGVFFRKSALNPSLSWSPDAKTKVVIKARMLDSTTVDYSGLPRASASANEPAAGVARSTFITATGLPDTTQKARGLNVQWTQVLNDDWTLKALAAHNTAEVDQRGVFPFPYGRTSLFGSGFGSSVNLAGLRLWEKLTSDTLQVSLNTSIKSGGALHRISFGLDQDKTRDDGFLAFANSPSFTPVNLLNYVRPAWGEPAVPAAANQQQNRSTSTVVYVQDQIQVGSWHLHGSLRHTRTEAKDLYADWGINNQSTNNKVTPRFGAVFDASDVVSFFGGYSQMSRVPFGSLFSVAPKMEEAEQKELGLRIKGWQGLSATAALFDIQRKNAAVSDPANPGFSVQTGVQQAKGLDVDVRWQASPSLAWIAAYTHQTAEITHDTNAAWVGKRLFNVPEQTMRVAARYDVRQGEWSGLGLGLGASHRSNLAGDTNNTFLMPAVTLWDAQASYKRGDIQYSASISNLLNKQYYAPMAYFGGGQVVPGLPRSLVVGISTKF
ncbi:TonB-dependent siderophore receptor [Limnohabitans sp. 63ED37-2]|uniref:TonB-dependent siderophore receptor n=1 Tax=Limnohabitans sp. 63ED37-2 TaxID=1678128 RepID=UPI000706A873|nr:TonB-dependent siderophore receptor [Limnohabitans sp. 63ED37-2]ALK89926.1 Ferrichrome-iron receptor precursor [Limnohabitans sp. 63ED37-2]